MNDIVDCGRRLPAIGKLRRRLLQGPEQSSARHVIAAALASRGVKPEQISEVIMGHVWTAGVGQTAARQASIYAGIQDMVPP